MTSTYASLMTAAHQTARQIRQQGETYAQAFAVALKAAWADLRLREREAAAKAQAEPILDYVYVLSGNTYAHRQTIREAGADWDAGRKVWVVAADRKGRCPKALASLKGVSWSRELAA